MKKNIKILGMGSAIVIAVLILLTAFTPILLAEQRLVPTEGESVIDRGLTDHESAIEKECPCLEGNTAICEYLVPGVVAIQSTPSYFDKICLGRDTTPEEYEERLEVVLAYCEDGTLPGDWYGDATGQDGLPGINAVLLCFALALGAYVVIPMIVIAIFITSISIGMTVLEAIATSDIDAYIVVEIVLTSISNCIELASG